MKKYFVLFFMLMVTAITFGQPQVTDSSSTITYNFGDSIMEFLKMNWKAIVAVALFLISEWVGETDAIPEGSIWRKVINFILTLAKKQVTKSPKMKRISGIYDKEIKAKSPKLDLNKAFKVLMIGVLLSGLTLGLTAQEKHFGRWYPFKKAEQYTFLKGVDAKTDSTVFFGASISFDVFTKEMKTGDYAVGAIPGVGYGIKWNPKWNPIQTKSFLSFDVFAQAALDKGDVAQYFNIKLLPMVGLLDWIHIGYGPVFKIGVNGTPGYNTGMFAISISTTL